MHKGFRVGEIEKPGNMGKFAKWYKCELLKRVQDQTGGGGLLGTVPGVQLSPSTTQKLKRPSPYIETINLLQTISFKPHPIKFKSYDR